MITEWNLDQAVGFLSSWSGTKIYQQKVGHHPLNEIWDDLLVAWGDAKVNRPTHWPLYMRIGKQSE